MPLKSAGIPAIKEPSDTARMESEHLDGISQILWRGRKALPWDVTVSCTLVDLSTAMAIIDVGAVVELAAAKNQQM
jgi:uncharacterized lipoprotein YbaY